MTLDTTVKEIYCDVSFTLQNYLAGMADQNHPFAVEWRSNSYRPVSVYVMDCMEMRMSNVSSEYKRNIYGS